MSDRLMSRKLKDNADDANSVQAFGRTDQERSASCEPEVNDAKAAQPEPAKRVRNREIQALAKLDEILAGLSPGAAADCMAWLSRRYAAPAPKEQVPA